MLYSFFVGSTDYYDAHTGSAHADAFPSLQFYRDNVFSEKLTGVWEGTEEATLQPNVSLESDAVAQRIAYAIGRRTANDAVLIVRHADETLDGYGMLSTARYRCDSVTVEEGNRTLTPFQSANGGVGWKLTPRTNGKYTAYLVWADASVTPVN